MRCGGTHVKNTSSIGHFSIITESALAAGVRRIEAVTSKTAIERLQKRSSILEKLELDLSAKEQKVLEVVENYKTDIKRKNKEIEQLKDKIESLQGNTLFENLEDIGSGFHYKDVSVSEDSDLRKLSDVFVDKHPKGILLLHKNQKDKISILMRIGKEVKSINCANILKSSLEILNGRGGGKPDMAQGSGDKTDKFDDFKKRIKESIIEAIL